MTAAAAAMNAMANLCFSGERTTLDGSDLNIIIAAWLPACLTCLPGSSRGDCFLMAFRKMGKSAHALARRTHLRAQVGKAWIRRLC